MINNNRPFPVDIPPKIPCPDSLAYVQFSEMAMSIMVLFLLSLIPMNTCPKVRSEEVKSSAKQTIA